MDNRLTGVRHSGVAWRSLALLLVLAATPLQAAFYKWTDESGQVNYSENPPPSSQTQAVEQISVKSGKSAPATMGVTEKEGVRTCGSLILPVKKPAPVTNIVMFRQAIAIWQKYLDENGDSTEAAIQQGVRDRQCAIAYANRELQALSEVEQGINSNYQRISRELEELQRRVAECDERAAEEEGFSSGSCKQQYQPRILQLEKMQRGIMVLE